MSDISANPTNVTLFLCCVFRTFCPPPPNELDEVPLAERSRLDRLSEPFRFFWKPDLSPWLHQG